MSSGHAFLIACALAAPGLAFPQATTVTVSLGADRSKHIIRGTVVTPETVLVGEVVIEADTIACVASNCTDPIGASVFTVTDGYVYPGFVDAHNHVANNVVPKWTPPQPYLNRGLLANHPQDVEMVWVGGELLYGRDSVLQKFRPGRCEALEVNGTKKRICVVDTTNPVAKSGQTLVDIRTILLNKYPHLSPLVR